MPDSLSLVPDNSDEIEPAENPRAYFSLSRPYVRYFNFASVYFLQGWIPGFSLTALFNFFSGHGITSMTLGGYFGIIGLPWAFQFLWGPLVDQVSNFRMGRHRFWIVSSAILSLIALSTLPLVSDPVRNVNLVGAVFFAHSLFASLFDTAIDAQLITFTPESERGRMSAVTGASMVIGGALGASFFAYTLSRYSFSMNALLLVGSSILFALPTMFVPEEKGRPLFSLKKLIRTEQITFRPLGVGRRFFLKLVALMRTPRSLFFLILCFGLQYLLSVTSLDLAVHLVQRQGWDPMRLSQIQATAALINGTLGIAIMGFVADRFGHRRVFRWMLFGIGTSFAAFTLFMNPESKLILFPMIVLFSGLVPDLLGVVFTPVLMDSSHRATVATQFSLYMAFTNLGNIVGTWSSNAIHTRVPLMTLAVFIAISFALAGFVMGRFDRDESF